MIGIDNILRASTFFFRTHGNRCTMFIRATDKEDIMILKSSKACIDVRRQIRWPTSLHGKSGLRVTEFPLSRLDPDGSNPFDPLSETIALRNNSSLSVEMIQDDCRFRFFEREWEPNFGDILDVPESTATFLILKGWAKIVK